MITEPCFPRCTRGRERRDEAEICFGLCHHVCATRGGNVANFQWERDRQERKKSIAKERTKTLSYLLNKINAKYLLFLQLSY